MNEQLKLENQLCFKIYSISKSLIRIYGPLLEDLEITYPQYLVMMVMWENHRLSFKDLSYKLKMKTGTLTPILTKLENMGFVSRVKDPMDDRKVDLEITQLGIDLEEKAKHIPSELACSAQLSEEEYLKYLKDFDDLIKKLDEVEKYFK